MKKVTSTHGELFQLIAKNIAKSKRQIVGVGKEKDRPAFAYTIGNQEKQLPELLLIGNFDPNTAAMVLSRLSDMLLDQNKPFDHGALINMGGKDSIAVWDAVWQVKHEYTFQAGEFYNNQEYAVQQVVIPDRKGRWPEDPKCHKGWKVPVYKVNKLVS